MSNIAYYKFQEVSTAKKKLVFVFPYKTQFISDDFDFLFGRAAYRRDVSNGIRRNVIERPSSVGFAASKWQQQTVYKNRCNWRVTEGRNWNLCLYNTLFFYPRLVAEHEICTEPPQIFCLSCCLVNSPAVSLQNSTNSLPLNSRRTGTFRSTSCMCLRLFPQFSGGSPTLL